MPFFSLTVRREFNAEVTDIVPIVLARISHASLAEPVLLSSDPTERFSADPLVYGTTSGGSQWPFVVMGVSLPDEARGALASGTLVLDNIQSTHSELLRSFSTPPAIIDLYMTFSHSPDVIEQTFAGLSISEIEYDGLQVRLSFRRIHVENEPFPPDNMTWQTHPGLFAGTTA